MAAQAGWLERLFDEHAKLDVLLERALDVASSDAWRNFRVALVAQMQSEEQELLEALPNDRSVRLLMLEHQHVRERVRELDGMRPEDRAKHLCDLRDILAAHARVTAAQLGASEASNVSIVDTNSPTFTGFVR